MSGFCALKRRPAAVAVAVLTFTLMWVMVFSRVGGWTEWRYMLITLASIGFVATAVVGGAHKNRYGVLMTVGLVGCCLGDLLGPYSFIWGSLSFLAAHLCFIAAFLTQGVAGDRFRAALGPVCVAFAAVTVWLLPHVPRGELWLVLSYMLVISAMLTSACGARVGSAYGILVSGATLFYISDLFVARWKYAAPGSINAWFCYPMYYSACILLALSVAVMTMTHEARDA